MIYFDDVDFECKTASEDETIDLIFRLFDDAYLKGDFDGVDIMLELSVISLYSMPISIIIGLLSITFCAKDKLNSRGIFVDYARKELEKRESPQRVERLLRGLA